MDDLLPEKKQNSATRTTYNNVSAVGGGGRSSSTNNVTCKPLTKTNSTSSQQSPKNLENADVATVRPNASGNSSIDNELKVRMSFLKQVIWI